ncbi:MAG TPA: outer membrane lipoprotein chaperone LolA [bacterium]|nr:outer membrane lipoprotein chaperone LolA [bacterium]
MRRIVLLLGFCTCLAVAGSNPMWDNVRSSYLDLKTLSGYFKETICSGNQGSCLEFNGRFAISVPDRYRIEVTEGTQQLFVSDGTTLWIYIPKLKQVMKRSGGGFAPVLAFLQPVLDSTVSVEVAKDSTGKYVVKALVEDEMSAMQDLVLELSDDGTLITGFSFTDGTGQKFHFSFSDQQWNTELDATMFKFTPPKGVTIVKE